MLVRLIRTFAILALLIVTACTTANTWLVQVWTEPSAADREVGKILIIGMAKEEVNRRVFETELSAHFEAKGVDAVASYTLLPELPEPGESGREIVRAAITDKGFNTILVTRLIDIEIQDHYIPGRTETTVEILEPTDIRFYKYYESTYTVVHEPGYLVQSEVVRLETNIYDVASESLIWTAISETFNPESASDVVRTFGVEVIKNLEKNKLLN